MQIYLTKPGGTKEGPFTLEQINRDLAAGVYADEEFWAWHEGLPNWVPLYSIAGVTEAEDSARASSDDVPAVAATPDAPSASAEPAASGADESSAPLKPQVASGIPFSALEQIFIFTTADGRSVFDSQVTIQMLQDTVGKPLNDIRGRIPVDVIGASDAGAIKTMCEGSIPASVWRAISAVKPIVARKAQDGLHRVCLRTFSAESNEAIAMFLLYNKEKLSPE